MRVRLLGPPRWQLVPGDEASLRPIGAVDAVLLYLLAAGGLRDRGALAARLWPDSEARLAQANLRQRVFRIRRALGPQAITGSATLALPAALGVDVRSAEAELAADPEAARGTLLDGIDWPDAALGAWLEAERRVWRHRLSRRLAGLASQALERGDARAALPYAARLVEEWPEDDAAYHRLMQLHYMEGDLVAAHAVYRRCEATLLREDGRRPGAPTRELAARIASALTAAAPGAPAGRAAPARLVGRQREWQRIERAWQAQRPLLLSGEPGIGKSRLLGDFAAVHGALAVAARPGDAERPYALAARLLEAVQARCGMPERAWVRQESARLLPGLGAPPPGPTYPLRLQAAIVEWWRHARRAGVPGIAIDDLQYADEASLERLLEVATEGRGGWLFAVRSAEWPALLERRLADARSDAVELLALEPLDRGGVAELLCGAGLAAPRAEALADGLWRHTGGNPYFVLQTVFESAPSPADRAAASGWTADPHLQDLLRRRLERLSPAARQLAQVGALAGADFSAELAARLLETPVLALGPAWLELERAQILRGEGFAHDLARDAVLSQLPAAITRAVHRRLGEAGPALGMPAAHQAGHWCAAGDERRAAAAWSVAAEEARRLSRRPEEAQWLDRAIASLARLGAADFALLERRIDAARYVDRYEAQLDWAGRLVDAARGDEERCRALVVSAAILRDGFQLAPARAAAEEASALAARLARPDCTLAAARELARVLMAQGLESEAVAVAWPHRDMALAAADVEAARFLIELAVVLGRAHRPREAWPLLRRARRVAEAAADWGLVAEAQLNLGYMLHIRAQVLRAALFYRQARETHRRTGSVYSVHLMHFVGLPRLYRELGRYGEALALLEDIRDEQRRTAGYTLSTVVDADLSYVWLQLGERERAEQALGRREQAPEGAYAPAWLMGWARLAWWDGEPATALLRQVFDSVSGESRILRWMVGRDLAMGLPPAEGVALARGLLAECEGVDCEMAAWTLRIGLCDRLLAAGEVAPAAALAASVLRAFGRRVLPSIYEPQAWDIVARALAADGRAAQAGAARDRGRRWIREALPRVPEAFREGFLQRNPYNRRLFAEDDELTPV